METKDKIVAWDWKLFPELRDERSWIYEGADQESSELVRAWGATTDTHTHTRTDAHHDTTDTHTQNGTRTHTHTGTHTVTNTRTHTPRHEEFDYLMHWMKFLANSLCNLLTVATHSFDQLVFHDMSVILVNVTLLPVLENTARSVEPTDPHQCLYFRLLMESEANKLEAA